MFAIKSSSVSKKGQTTIPREVRERLNLKEGDTVIFELKNDGQVLLRKSPSFEEMEYLKSIEKTLAPEWMSEDDDDL